MTLTAFPDPLQTVHHYQMQLLLDLLDIEYFQKHSYLQKLSILCILGAEGHKILSRLKMQKKMKLDELD